jgi:xylose isomerase
LETIKNSVGIWTFGPAVTRFVPPGYHPEAASEPQTEKTRRVAEGLSDLLDGLEYHYPGEVNEENVEEILSILKEYGMDLPVIAAGLHTDPTYALGAFINSDEKLRRQGVDTLKRGVDLCAQVGANFIIWPGAEGYNYIFQRPYAQVWRAFTEAIAELTDHANLDHRQPCHYRVSGPPRSSGFATRSRRTTPGSPKSSARWYREVIRQNGLPNGDAVGG